MSDLIQEIQPDFSFSSNYDEKSSESSVRFGANAPVLEAELNELQEIQNKAKEDIIRDSIPSGFLISPTISTIYTTENIDKLRINNTPVAYVNGYRIEIPSSTFIDIGLPPEKDIREDLVFLEVWREVVDGTSTLTLNGGEGLGKIPNKIIDPREGVETSRRVVTRWRIRCEESKLFNTPQISYGLGSNTNAFPTEIYKDLIMPQGALDSPFKAKNNDEYFMNMFRLANISQFDWQKEVSKKDSTLFVAGVSSKRANKFKTVDGLVYAIPMFKLIRRPSTGVLKGDYTSIAPTCDYDKVQNILAEEKVSGFKAGDVTLELEGKTFRNLHPKRNYSFACDSVNDNNYVRIEESINTASIKVTNTLTSWRYFNCGAIYKNIFKPNTKYTIVGEFQNIGTIKLQSADGKYFYSNGSVATNNKAVITTLSQAELDKIPEDKEIVVYCLLSDTIDIKSVKNVMIFEGELNVEISSYFEGMQSVGEDKVAFREFFSWRDTITPPSSGTTDLATFKFKPKTNLVKIVPVNAKGKEISHPSIAYQLQDINGSKVAQRGADASISLTDNQLQTIEKVNVFYNNFAPEGQIIGFNIYDGYCVRLKSNFRNEKESLLEVNLKEPLRELPDGTRDTVAVNGIVNRKTGRIILDDTTNWTTYPDQHNTNVLCFHTAPIPNLTKNKNLICNRFDTGYYWNLDIEVLTIDTMYSTERFFLKIKKSRLETQDVQGLKKWLKANPIEVIYEKAQFSTLNSLPNGVSDLDDGQGTITRNVKQVTCNGVENWQQAGTQFSGTYSAYLDIEGGLKDALNSVKIESLNMLPDYSTNEEGYFILDSGLESSVRIVIRLNSNKLATQDTKGFTDYLKANPLKVSYQLKVPTIETYSTERAEFVGDLLFNSCDTTIASQNNITPKINLTHKANMNVDLFEGYTEVACNSLIAPTLAVKDEVGEGILKLAPLKDDENVPVKLEGKTYQNMLNVGWESSPSLLQNFVFSDGIMTIQGTDSYATFLFKDFMFKPNTTYTLITNVLENDFSTANFRLLMLGEGDGTGKQNVSVDLMDNEVGFIKKKFTTPNVPITVVQSFTRPSSTGRRARISNLLVLEGDYTNKQVPPYFEGIASVGKGEDVLSVTSRGKNLFNHKNYASNNGVLVEYIDDGYILTGTADWKTLTYKFKVEPNTKYFLKLNREYISGDKGTTIVVKDGDNKIIDDYQATGKYGLSEYSFTPISSNLTIIIFASTSASSKSKITNIMLSKEDIPYEPYKGSVKSISLGANGGLNGLPNGVCDVIERKESKHYLEKKIGKAVLDGSDDEQISMSSNQAEGYLTVKIRNNNVVNESELICSHFIKNNDTWKPNFLSEGIQTVKYSPNEGYFLIKINQSKVSINAPAGFRAWLKENPITIYYELAEPIVSELITNLVIEEREATFGLAGQVGYKRTVEGSIFAENILLTQSLNPNWHQVGEVRKYKYTLNRGSILDLLNVPLIPGSQLGSDDSLSCPYKIKIIKVLPNSECLAKNIGKNAIGGQAEQFVAPQFLNTRIFKDDIDEIYPRVSLTGWDYNQLLEETLLKILK